MRNQNRGPEKTQEGNKIQELKIICYAQICTENKTYKDKVLHLGIYKSNKGIAQLYTPAMYLIIALNQT